MTAQQYVFTYVPIAVCKKIKAMSGSPAFVPIASIFVSIRKGHFTFALSTSVYEFSDVPPTIGLCQITKAVPSIIFICAGIGITIPICSHSLTLPMAFKPLSDVVRIKAAFKAFYRTISVRVGRWVPQGS